MLDKDMHILSIGTNKHRPPISGGRKLLARGSMVGCQRDLHQRYLDGATCWISVQMYVVFIIESLCSKAFIATGIIDTPTNLNGI